MKVAGTVAGLLLAYAFGWLLAWRLWPGRAKPACLLAALAWPAGLSLTSSAYFLWMVASGGRAAWYPGLEFGCLVAACVPWWRGRRRRRSRCVLPPRLSPGPTTLALLALLSASALSLFLTVRFAAEAPWGFWDAWARINLKARFLHEGGADWTWVFRGVGVPHPDYPLLLECSVARLWRFSGGPDPLAPQTLSVLNWSACLAALVVWVAHLRSGLVAAAAGLAFLCKKPDVWWAAMQYADFALATTFVWSAALLSRAAGDGQRAERWWPLLGFCAGSAAWCKNEGLAFATIALALAAFVTVRKVAAPRRGRAAAALGGGLLLSGLAVAVLKLGFAGQSAVFGTRTRSPMADLTDPSRYETIRSLLMPYLSTEVIGAALALLVLAVVLAPPGRAARRSWLPLAACALMALVYCVVMVTTREDLVGHVTTCLDRLILQLWPLAILGVTSALHARA